jgi:hypothetical protein
VIGKQTPEEARRDRVNKDDRRDAAYLAERKRIETANTEKTNRLRALRLEKEAAERAANPDGVVKKKKKKPAARAAAAASGKLS